MIASGLFCAGEDLTGAHTGVTAFWDPSPSPKTFCLKVADPTSSKGHVCMEKRGEISTYNIIQHPSNECNKAWMLVT